MASVSWQGMTGEDFLSGFRSGVRWMVRSRSGLRSRGKWMVRSSFPGCVVVCGLLGLVPGCVVEVDGYLSF